MVKVNVYEEGGVSLKIVARVSYDDNLDRWDGSNYSSGVGRHKGITRLKNGNYVIIHGTIWEGESDYGEIVSADEALQEVLLSGNEHLLEKYGLDEKSENLLKEEG